MIQTQVFSKEWFVKHQKPLLWFANTSVGRSVLGIDGNRSSVGQNKIIHILPNSIYWQNEDKSCSAEFRTNDKFGLIAYNRLKYIWEAMHWWDMNIANSLEKPELNLGFDTLTVYPDSGTGGTTVDGYAARALGIGQSYAFITGGVGTFANATDSSNFYVHLLTDSSESFTQNFRSLFLFDTSSLGAGSSISSAVLSLYGISKDNGLGSDSINIVSSSPSVDNNISTSDYGSLGTTSYANISYASYSTSGYNDFTLNASGISNVSKTGISKFGGRSEWDRTSTYGGNTNTDSTSMSGDYADQTGTSQDPKLVITFTSGVVSFTPKITFF